MFLIAHRGNFEGPCPEFENRPHYLMEGLDHSRDVHMEIDVWLKEGQLYLGHDYPQYKINDDFLINARFWCHAKNLPAFEYMLNNPIIHCFWHQNDDYVLTSRGYIWTFPGRNLGPQSICVMPEMQLVPQDALDKVAGICTDYIDRYRREL